MPLAAGRFAAVPKAVEGDMMPVEMMNAERQHRLLQKIEGHLDDACLAAGQLPGGKPLLQKLADARRLANAWRCDQEAELTEETQP